MSGNDKAILKEQLSDYVTFKIDKRELIEMLYTYGKCQFQLLIEKQLDWTLDLEFNDMRSPDFKQTYISDKGEFEVKESFNLNIFKGKTSEGRIARFTIDENSFFGIILYDNFHYVIRPTKDYTKNREDESYIVYKSCDIIANDNDFDYINDALEAPEDENIFTENMELEIMENRSSYSDCAWFLRIATDADFQFYVNRGGSNLTNTYNEIFSVLNIVEGVYESTFSMKFIITFQNVYTTSTTPYTSTDASKLLDQFRNQWNSNRKSVSRNIAHLFTGKNLDGGTLGISWKGQISNPNANLTSAYSYSLSMDRLRMYQTTAHEIGHNLNADDVNLLNPEPAECLCNFALQRSVMCQGDWKNENLWFCDPSIQQILPFILFRNSYLKRNLTNDYNLSGNLTGFNSYEAIKTITSSQVINSGFTSYKAGTKIVLSPGFHAKSGTIFSATIEDATDCFILNPIVDDYSRNVVAGFSLDFKIRNAISYSCTINSALSWQTIYSGSGNISSYYVNIWNVPSSTPFGIYYAHLTLYSPNSTVTDVYPFTVLKFFKSDESEEDESREFFQTDNNKVENFSFSIYPNPNDGNFTLIIEANKIEPFTIEIINSLGVLVSQTDYCDTYIVNINQTDLLPGIYFVKLTMGNNVSTKKIVIQ
jgi:hypothetical protein